MCECEWPRERERERVVEPRAHSLALLVYSFRGKDSFIGTGYTEFMGCLEGGGGGVVV